MTLLWTPQVEDTEKTYIFQIVREGQELKVICYGDDSGKEVSFLPFTKLM